MLANLYLVSFFPFPGIRNVYPLIELDLFIIELDFKRGLLGSVKHTSPLKMEQEKRWVPL